jgi:hypothetical protein
VNKSRWQQTWISIDLRALIALWKYAPRIGFFVKLGRILLHRCWGLIRFLRTWRRIGLHRDEICMYMFSLRKDKSSPKVFNLDLHIGVISDLEQAFNHFDIPVTRWSISGHNHLVDGRLPVSDPVKFVNQRSWRSLDPDLIEKFQSRYGNFLRRFDGFVCTYSPTFAEIYKDLGKPILAVAATRYEAPYTDRLADWDRFNKYLAYGVNQGKIILGANNQGDADYISFFTGLIVPVIPSLCTKPIWSATKKGPRVVMSHDQRLIELVETRTRHAYKRVGVLGSPYDWSTLAQCQEVLVFPQNISTMTLFELSTAGVPEAVPSRRWVRELRENGFGVLDECTFYELLNLPCDDLTVENPINYRSDKYLDWWLDRADFYNTDFMPNVRIVDSVEELTASTNRDVFCDDLRVATNLQNSNIATLRHNFIKGFADLL